MELQVVQQKEFSGAAGGAAIFLAILICAAAWWRQQHRYCGSGGAVMTAAGTAAILGGAASAVRISTEELCGVTAATIQRFRYVQLRGGGNSTNTAGGAMMTATRAAKVLGGFSIGELRRVPATTFAAISVETAATGAQRVDACNCVVTAAARDAAEKSQWSCSWAAAANEEIQWRCS